MFKKIAILLIIAIFSAQAQSQQTPSVEKSVWSIETGPVGLWVSHELKLGNQFALRTEAGAEMISITYRNDEMKTAFAPVVSIEPKWYYNLKKRLRKGHHIEKNSGNSFSIKFNYNPDVFLIGDSEIANTNHLAILPKWGIRRVYGKHFTFEAGFGIGPQFYIGNNPMWKESSLYVDGHLRIGYTF